ncbi:DUF4149 domain-containing protein [soil metagenome]
MRFRFAQHARRVIATFWVGSLWAVGYVVAPTLFATLYDKVLAGTIAGSLFRIEAWLSLACAFLLTVLTWSAAKIEAAPMRTQLKLIGAMLGCTLLGYFALHPFIAALREAAGPGGVMASEARLQFGILHGISSAIYFIQSLIGAALILKLK